MMSFPTNTGQVLGPYANRLPRIVYDGSCLVAFSRPFDGEVRLRFGCQSPCQMFPSFWHPKRPLLHRMQWTTPRNPMELAVRFRI